MELEENLNDLPTEQEFNEAFGLEPEEPDNEGTEGTAEDEGGQGDGQGTQNPAEGQETTTEGGNGADGGGEESQEMPLEERHRQAAMRRAREEQARQEAYQASMQASRDEVFREMFGRQTNPFTGRPIMGEADYRDYQRQMQQYEARQRMEEAGIDPSMIQEAVQQELAPMRQQLEYQRLQELENRARQASQRAQEAIQAAVTNMAAELPDANIKTLEDVTKLPTGAAFNAYVQKGYSLEDAFYLANRKEIGARSIRAARTSALENAQSMGHLGPVGAGDGTAVPVPKGVVAAYRQIMPDATDQEIREAYLAELK